MNATSCRVPKWSAGATGTPEPIYGACPNCDRTLHVAATVCPHCRAIFDRTAAWRVVPDARRVPDEGTTLSVPPPAAPGETPAEAQRAALLRALPPHSLAAQILECSGAVTLEQHRRSFSAIVALARSAYVWGYFSLLVLLEVGRRAESDLDTVVKVWLWLTPVALVVMYRLEAAADDWEVALRTVQIDLAAGELTIEQRLVGETECATRRVPVARLRLAVQWMPSSVDREGFDCLRSPGISLLVPADLPRWPAQALALLPAEHDNPHSAAAAYAALLAHAGIPPLTTTADAAGAR